MVDHRDDDFLLGRIAVAEHEENCDVVGQRVSAGVADAYFADAAVGTLLLRHELLTGREQLLTVVVGKAVGSDLAFEEMGIVAGGEVGVVAFSSQCRLLLGGRGGAVCESGDGGEGKDGGDGQDGQDG